MPRIHSLARSLATDLRSQVTGLTNHHSTTFHNSTRSTYNPLMRRIRRALLILLALLAGWTAYGLIESKLLATDDVAPTSQNAPIELDAETVSFLKTITSAHAQPFTISGTLRGNFDVAGQVDQSEFKFTSTFGGANQFRQDSPDLLLISDGKHLSIYDPKANLFSTNPFDAKQLSKSVASILELQNPALLVAIRADAERALFPSGTKFISAKRDDSIEIHTENDGVSVRYQFDSNGHFQVIDYDFRQLLERQGVTGIKSATYKITFDQIEPAKTDGETFKFIAPTGARDLAKEPRLAIPQSAIEKLLNQPAPPFEGRDLDGNVIGLFGFKDRVVVLDFWATWCGPCKPALDHLKTYKERFGDDVMILTINSEGADDLDETAKKVRAYFEKNDFDFKTILDNGEISQAYYAASFPTRILIGRDGTVKRIAVSARPNITAEFDEAVEAEIKSN